MRYRPLGVAIAGMAIGTAAGVFTERRKEHIVRILHPPRQPYTDWGRALAYYLKKRYQLLAVTTHYAPNDPDVDVTMRSLHSDRVALIPMSVEVTQALAENKIASAILCTDNPDIYDMLNDKGRQSVEILTSHGISSLPTFDMGDRAAATGDALREFVARNDAKQYVLKPSKGAGSQHHKIITREEVIGTMARLLNQRLWEKPCVIQPYHSSHATVEFNFFALDGEIVDSLCTISECGLSEEMWERGLVLKTYRGKALENIVRFAKSVVAKHRLSGLMEFEFLRVRDDHDVETLYFLECNPRISSSVVAFDADGISPYVEKLVIPYLIAVGVLANDVVARESNFDVFEYPPDCEAEKTLKRML